MKIKSLTLAGLVCFGVVCSGEVLAASKASVTNLTPYLTAIQCSGMPTVLIASHANGNVPLRASGEGCNVNITDGGNSISSGAMYYQVQNNKIAFTWTFGQPHIGSSLNASGTINGGNSWAATQNPGRGSNMYNTNSIPSNPAGDSINIVLTA